MKRVIKFSLTISMTAFLPMSSMAGYSAADYAAGQGIERVTAPSWSQSVTAPADHQTSSSQDKTTPTSDVKPAFRGRSRSEWGLTTAWDLNRSRE